MSTALYSIVNNMAIQLRNLDAKVNDLSAQGTVGTAPVVAAAPAPPPPPSVSKDEFEALRRQVGDIHLKITNVGKDLQVMETTLTHKMEQFTLRLVKDRIDNIDFKSLIPAAPAAAAVAPAVDVEALKAAAVNAATAVVPGIVSKAVQDAVSKAVAQAMTDIALPVKESSTSDVDSVLEAIAAAAHADAPVDIVDVQAATPVKQRKERTIRKKTLAV